MADSLCGPSNPLQNLQKQTLVDRTLQQDRLISRQSPGQGFRSAGPNAGVLDPEFERFQAGQAPFSGLEARGVNQPAFLANQRPLQNGSLHQSQNWAGDFANISPAGSPSVAHPGAVHAQQLAQHGNWKAEFEGQHAQMSRQGQIGQNVLFSNQGQIPYGAQFGGQAMGSGWAPSPYQSEVPLMNFQNQQGQLPQGQVTEDPFSREAWDKVFEEFEQAESSSVPVTEKETEIQDDTEAREASEVIEQQELVNENHDHNPPENNLEPENIDDNFVTKRIGADLIINPITDVPREQRHQTHPDEENEALARTAGNLLDSISDNQDPKFQNSRFLRLMQQFRDREVAVQGNKIVDFQNGANHQFDREGNAEVGVVSS